MLKTIIFLLFPVVALSQTPDIETLKQQAKAAGYSDSQINAAIQQVQGQANTGVQSATTAPGAQVMEVTGKSEEPVFVNENADTEEAGTGIQKFGYLLLKSESKTFNPNEYGPVPDDYVIGTNDELQLSVWGQSEFYLKAEVDRRGMIQIPSVGLVAVSGFTLKQAEGVLKERVSRSYAGIRTGESKFAVTLSKIRSIRVYVGGMVNKPGAYKLTAISSVLTALYAAGGLSENADFRNVTIIKPDGTIDSVDLYANLLGVVSSKQDKIDHNYMIMVKGESFPVQITGAVNQPGIYDLKTGEDFKTLLSFAGGPVPTAWLGSVEIRRVVSGEGTKSLSFDGYKNPDFKLVSGDKVFIKTSANTSFNLVKVKGAVKQPGTFQYEPGMRVKSLIESAGGLLDWAYLERGELLISEKDKSLSIKAFHVGKAMAGDPTENILIPDQSELLIKSIWEIDSRYNISVIGFVNSPNEFEYRKGMTVGDAIFLANGFSKEAYTAWIEVARVDPSDSTHNDRTIAFVKTITNTGILSKDNKSLDFPLEPMDQVYVRKNPYFEVQRTVQIKGEVKFPGSYSLTNKDEKLASVIARAGGLKSTAYTEGATIFRKRDNIGMIALDFNEALSDKDSKENLILMPDDLITIPERDFTVKVRGQVPVETSILYSENASVNYYIEQAGGLNEMADNDKIYVILPNGRVFRPGNFWAFHPEILSGSVIIVPTREKQEPVDWRGWVTITTSTITSLVTLIILLQRTNQ